MKLKQYKGYKSKIVWYQEDGLYVGNIIEISDLVLFHGKTKEELEKSFHSMVNDYISFCEEIGKKPEKSN